MLEESVAMRLRVIMSIQVCLDYVRFMGYNGKLVGGRGSWWLITSAGVVLSIDVGGRRESLYVFPPFVCAA